MLRKFDSWQQTECDECGDRYQVTRTMPRELERCVCNDCEIYARGYQDGLKHAALKIERIKANIVDLMKVEDSESDAVMNDVLYSSLKTIDRINSE
jgi:hypothetical protein